MLLKDSEKLDQLFHMTMPLYGAVILLGNAGK
jgi:hypothetical protein